MDVLRELAVAVITGEDATAEGAPSPETETETSTRGNCCASKAYLPVLCTISQSGRRSEDTEHCRG
jgi:hypothetical protein